MPNGYSIKARGKSDAELVLYGDIGESWFGGVSAKQVNDDLKALGDVNTINVRINSAGGDVFDGLTIYRRLVDHKAKIIVHVDGLAASIASVIAMAGNEINIGESALLMVHNAWGVAIGTSDDMRTMGSLLDTTTASIRDVYVARTNNSAEKITGWMDAETWFTAAEAVDAGFASSVVDNLRMAAKFDPAKHKFRNAPAALSATPNLTAMRQRLAQMRAKMDRRRAA
jgi:ATP-dependent Clp protease protease subunit